jgi:large subunit ribosomal protein LP0
MQTTIRKVIKDFLKKNEGHPIGNLLPELVGNVGLVFTNDSLTKVRDIIVANKVPAPARIGSIAPVDVFVEPGPTGCDPGQTGWFQALNIPTKINKGQIEMISKVHLVKLGNKVTDSQAALLQKLNIKPFSYGLVVQKVYDNGAIFDPKVLDISDEDVLSKFGAGVATLAALSLALGLPNKASITHSINDAYKALIAISIGTDFKFKQAKAFEDFLANPGNFAAAPAAASGGAAAPAAAAAKKEEEEEEEDVGGAGGLFGGGDDDW